MSRGRLVSTLLTAMLVCSMAAACLLFQDVGDAVLRALPALALAAAVHVAQLAATAMAWRGLFHAPTPGFGLMLRARWIRESLNGLLPLMGIGGGILASTAVVRQTGWPFAGVAAGATVDLLVEASTQLPFLLAGLVILKMVVPGTLPGTHADLLLLPLALAVAAALALRAGICRGPAMRLARRVGLSDTLSRLRGALAVVDTRGWTLLAAAAWHFLAWSLGTAEVWVIFWVLGTPAGLAEAYAIQSLGMAARSLGFVVPAGLGAQEAGLIIVAVALGVPVEDAVAMSMLKRLREVLMNLPGLLVWHRLERRAVHSGHV